MYDLREHFVHPEVEMLSRSEVVLQMNMTDSNFSLLKEVVRCITPVTTYISENTLQESINTSLLSINKLPIINTKHYKKYVPSLTIISNLTLATVVMFSAYNVLNKFNYSKNVIDYVKGSTPNVSIDNPVTTTQTPFMTNLSYGMEKLNMIKNVVTVFTTARYAYNFLMSSDATELEKLIDEENNLLTDIRNTIDHTKISHLKNSKNDIHLNDMMHTLVSIRYKIHELQGKSYVPTSEKVWNSVYNLQVLQDILTYIESVNKLDNDLTNAEISTNQSSSEQIVDTNEIKNKQLEGYNRLILLIKDLIYSFFTDNIIFGKECNRKIDDTFEEINKSTKYYPKYPVYTIDNVGDTIE